MIQVLNFSRFMTILVAIGLAVSSVVAQVQQVIVTTDNGDPFGYKNTDAGLSVHGDAIVSTSNMRLSIFAKTGGTALQTYQVGDGGFPFKRAAAPNLPYDPPSRFFDPRTVYDPENNRLWVIYAEDNVGAEFGSVGDVPVVHVAVSRAMIQGNTLDTLGNADWWYYTGQVGDAGNGGVAFDFGDADLQEFRVDLLNPMHQPFPEDDSEGVAFVDLPTIAIDDQAAYITGYSSEWDPAPSQARFSAVVIIPLSHDGGAKSILNGQRPDESDLVIMRFGDIQGTPDNHVRQYAVQEPYASQQADNTQLFVSVSEGVEEQTGIRIGGLWYNTTASQWEYSQRTVSGVLTDMPLAAGRKFFYLNSAHQPQTPDTGSNPFRPNLGGSFFASAVLCKDAEGNMRVFATHHVAPSDEATPTAAAENQWVVQWYVIDPKLGDVQTTTANAWQPSIVASGRIDGGGEGDFYHPVIGVTRQGVAYIEYTYSDGSDYPRMERVRLNSSYTTVSTTTPVEDGGQLSYSSLGGWADFADMQADPTLCKLWSVHTLVHDDTVDDPTHKRDIWLFENAYAQTCFSPDTNENGLVEADDALLYNDYYAAQDARADANHDGAVDPTDAAIFLDAYAAGVP